MEKNNKHLKVNLFLLVIAAILFYQKIDKLVLLEPPNINKINVVSNNSGNNHVKLIACTDGDSANFSKLGKTRFLIVDTPESVGKYKNKPQYKGKEASKYTCEMLKKAKKITYEYDGNKKDKYNRSLVYIFVDGKLLQEEIAKQGYVKKFYLYKSYYKYEKRIKNAIDDKYGIWQGK